MTRRILFSLLTLFVTGCLLLSVVAIAGVLLFVRP